MEKPVCPLCTKAGKWNCECAREIKKYGMALRYILPLNREICESRGKAVAGRMGINQAKSTSEEG